MPKVKNQLHGKNWKIDYQAYSFFREAVKYFRQYTGRAFDKKLKAWLFFNQERRLKANEYLQFVELFDACAEIRNMDCKKECPDYKTCMDLFEIISNKSDYSPAKVNGYGKEIFPQPFAVHGQAKEVLKLLDLRF